MTEPTTDPDREAKKMRKRKQRDAELRQAVAEAESAELELERKRIDLAAARDQRAVHCAQPDLIGQFGFNSVVGEAAVENLRSRLLNYSERNPREPISISFTTPGGSVFDGIHLHDTIRSLSAKGHEITTIASGFAASMGFVLLQAGDHRVMGPETLLMLHEVSSLAIGKAGEIRRESEFLDKVTKQFCMIASRRSTLSDAEIYERIADRDWWLWSEDALQFGFVDEVRPV